MPLQQYTNPVTGGLLGLLFLLSSLSFPSYAQQQDNSETPFGEARELAFEGNYSEAEQILKTLLEESPDYHEVRLFLARMYSWNNQYDESLEQIAYILDRREDHRRAMDLRITVLLWDEQNRRALHLAEEAVEAHPDNVDLRLQKARALRALEHYDRALQQLEQAQELNPEHPEVAQLRQNIRENRLTYTLTLAANHDRFSEIFDPWTTSYIQLERDTGYGPVIARLNMHDRFGRFGVQPEMDWYPTIAEGVYGYLNAGISSSSLFPEYRAGAELYYGLPRGFEASLGMRYMRFASDVWIYTGSLTYYYENWMFTLRPFFTPQESGASRSYNITIRRYLGSAENYLDLESGFGFFPHERFLQGEDRDLNFQQSQYVRLMLQHDLNYRFAAFGGLRLSRQEKRFEPGNFYRIFSAELGIEYRF